jgi:hypothetical protein
MKVNKNIQTENVLQFVHVQGHSAGQGSWTMACASLALWSCLVCHVVPFRISMVSSATAPVVSPPNTAGAPAVDIETL